MGRQASASAATLWLSMPSLTSYSMEIEVRSPGSGLSNASKGNAPLTEPPSTGSVSEPSPLKGAILERKQLHFLATKVIPPRCQGLIARPRLLGMASQLSGKRLAVIKAPAGFGKTSLAVAWLQGLQQSGNVVGWLTIDPDDDEPTTFIFYLCHALQCVCNGVGTTASAPSRPVSSGSTQPKRAASSPRP